MSIDHLLGKTYNRNTYNCAHFVCDVWKAVTGEDISDTMKGFLLAVYERTVPTGLQREFVRHASPVSPCIVMFRRKGKTPHVGVYFKNRVAHITTTGACYQPLDVASFGYTNVRFYTC